MKFFKKIPIINDGHQSYHSFPVSVGPTEGWRSVARLAVRNDTDGKLKVGLFLPGTHELLEVPSCVAHHPSINSMVQYFTNQCHKHCIQAFNEHTGAGNLRYIAVSVELSTEKQQIVLVWKDDDDDEAKSKSNASLQKLIQSLIDKTKEDDDNNEVDLHSLWIHHNNTWKHSNSIFDRNGTWEQKFGVNDGRIEEIPLKDAITAFQSKKLKVPLYFPPQVFRQANLPAFCKIVLRIREWLTDKLLQPADESNTKKKQRRFGHCLELYGGVGTIGLHLIDLFDAFESSDENPYNKDCFEASVKKVTIDNKPLSKLVRSNITYQSKSATEMVLKTTKISHADVIIVDPPRKGLDTEVVDGLCGDYYTGPSANPQCLIYVSCGFDAFRRDYDALVGSGKWRLDSAEGHILFPGSDAIETLAFFTRR
jgi:tRNA/tmRNA/rRNA uracil-C5-methylase (TrmA/RlmC/RlmD family)